MVNKEEIIELYKVGKLSLSQIGNLYGVSRQRINHIVRDVNKNTRWQRMTDSVVIHPLLSEKCIGERLKNASIPFAYMPWGAPYDLLINGKYKIEIKHRTKVTSTGISIQIYNKDIIDYLIVLVGELSNPLIYVFPQPLLHALYFNPYPQYNTRYNRTRIILSLAAFLKRMTS